MSKEEETGLGQSENQIQRYEDKNLIQKYSDEKLVFETENLVRSERELLTQILHHLREIERRRLYSKYKFSSLFDYAVKKLGYSEDQAGRRISAMRFLKALPVEMQPQVEKKISSGALSLTHLNLAHTFVRKETLVSQELKLDLLSQIENRPTREAEKIVISMASEPNLFFKDRVRPVSQELNEVKFHADEALLQKIEKLKGLLAHKYPNISMAELLNKLCDLGIEKWDLGLKAEKRNQATNQKPKELLRSPAAPRVNVLKSDLDEKLKSPLKSELVKPRLSLNTPEKPLSKAAIHREVWRKAKSCCENCKSTYALQIDHIKPRARGGTDDPENFRLLCRSCNQRAAIHNFGQQKMDFYLR